MPDAPLIFVIDYDEYKKVREEMIPLKTQLTSNTTQLILSLI
jgi:hypothetical protein